MDRADRSIRHRDHAASVYYVGKQDEEKGERETVCRYYKN